MYLRSNGALNITSCLYKGNESNSFGGALELSGTGTKSIISTAINNNI